MNDLSLNTDQKAENAFTAQSVVFDDLYGHDSMIAYKRRRVREHMMQYLETGNKMLELNCGTGEDAVYFAGKGFTVHATDISDGMLARFRTKVSTHKLEEQISIERCSFTSLTDLRDRGPYDYIYSNFGGLNCTAELGKVLSDMTMLIKPGGYLTLVIISRFCLWETLLVLRGKFRTAFRRFFSSRGRKANIEKMAFQCWYYTPSFVSKRLASDFETIGVEGLCTIVPPSYIKGFAEKYPRTFAFLSRQESIRKSKFPWKYIGDYFIITLRKR